MGERLCQTGVGPGDLVALVVAPGIGLAMSAERRGSSISLVDGGGAEVRLVCGH